MKSLPQVRSLKIYSNFSHSFTFCACRSAGLHAFLLLVVSLIFTSHQNYIYYINGNATQILKTVAGHWYFFLLPLNYATLTLCVDESCCRCISVNIRDALQLLILHIFHLHLLETFPRSIHGEHLHSERRSDEEMRVCQQHTHLSLLSCSLSSERFVFMFHLFISHPLNSSLADGREMLLFANLLAPIESQRRTGMELPVPNTNSLFIYLFIYLCRVEF